MSGAQQLLRTFDFKANGYDLQVRAVSIEAAAETLHRTLPHTEWHSLREAVTQDSQP